MTGWLQIFALILFCICSAAVWAQESMPNRVLSLDGDGDYVEMADSEALNDIGSQVTMEVWIKATAFPGQWIPIINKADESAGPGWGNRSYVLTLNSSGFIELASAPGRQGHLTLNSPNGLIVLNTWYHVAGVIDAKNGVMRISINGVEVARKDSGRDVHVSKLPLRIGGWRHEESRSSFEGQMDELRIWNVARIQEEIQQTMHRTLSGDEPGLVGYWNFDDVGSPTTRIKLWESLSKEEREGAVADSRYDGRTFDNFTKEDGLLHNNVSDLHVGPDGVVWASISGQPSRRGGVSRYDGVGFVNFTEEDGLLTSSAKDIHVDSDGVLWTVAGSVMEHFERGGVSRYDEKTFISFTTKDGLPSNNVKSVYIDPDGILWVGTLDGLARYDGKEFVNFTTEDGLTDNMVSVIHRDRNGIMWFGTGRGSFGSANGVSRYDDRGMGDSPHFTNFTSKDGLADNTVNDIYTDPDGVVWFGTRSGLTRYDGEEFMSFTQDDGLASSTVYSIRRDPNGMMWFGTGQGISCYDGSKYYSPDAEVPVLEALRKTNSVGFGRLLNCPMAIEPDSMALWFGIYGFGVFRSHDKEVVNFTDKDGLADNIINAIYRDRDGVL